MDPLEKLLNAAAEVAGVEVAEVAGNDTLEKIATLLADSLPATVHGGVSPLDGDSAVAVKRSSNTVHRRALLFTNKQIAMTDAGAAGSHGSLHLFTLPEGTVELMSYRVELDVVAAEGISETANMEIAIGTMAVETDNATLTGAEANIVEPVAVALVDAEGQCNGASGAAPSPLTDSTQGTAGEEIEALADLSTGDSYTDAAVNQKLGILRNWAASLTAAINQLNHRVGGIRLILTEANEIHLNVAIPGDDSEDDSTITVTGRIEFTYINHG